MRVVYIAHPFRNNPAENIEAVKKYIRLAMQMGYAPICTLTMFGDIEAGVDEEDIMEMCYRYIDLADEVWFCGNWLRSKGCQMEYCYSWLNDKTIRYWNCIDGEIREVYVNYQEAEQCG